MPDQEGQPFIRDAAKFEGERIRVRLRIDDVLSQPIGRDELLQHPVLKDLQIIRFANATNFKVSPEERGALDELFAGQLESDPDLHLQLYFEEILESYSEARQRGCIR